MTHQGALLIHDPGRAGGGGGVLRMMANKGRLGPKGVSFSGFRYMEG